MSTILEQLIDTRDIDGIDLLHVDRVLRLGFALIFHNNVYGQFSTEEAFLEWAGSELQCPPSSVRQSIEQTDLWIPSEGGTPNWGQLTLMQDLIVLHMYKQVREIADPMVKGFP